MRYNGGFVETPEFAQEQEADSILFRNTFGTQRAGGFKANALDLKLKNVANTNVVAWGKKLLALFEAGIPTSLDPLTLETLGEWDPTHADGSSDKVTVRGVTMSLDGLDSFLGLGKGHTAHPYVDPLKGHLQCRF